MPTLSRHGHIVCSLRDCISLIAVFASLCLALSPTSAQAQVSINGSYQLIGGQYHYNFAVVNGTADDLVLATARLTDHTFSISNVVAPAGFMLNYSEADGNSNGIPDAYLDFLPDGGSTLTFSPFSTVSGFAFTTNEVLEGFTFEGLTSGGSPAVGSVGVAPEPTALALLLPGLTTAGILLRRRFRHS